MLGQVGVEGPLGALSLTGSKPVWHLAVASGRNAALGQRLVSWPLSKQTCPCQPARPWESDSTLRLCAPKETGGPTDTQLSQPGGLSIPGALPEGPLLPWPLGPPRFRAVAGPSPGTDMAVASLCAWPTLSSSHS